MERPNNWPLLLVQYCKFVYFIFLTITSSSYLAFSKSIQDNQKFFFSFILLWLNGIEWMTKQLNCMQKIIFRIFLFLFLLSIFVCLLIPFLLRFERFVEKPVKFSCVLISLPFAAYLLLLKMTRQRFFFQFFFCFLLFNSVFQISIFCNFLSS